MTSSTKSNTSTADDEAQIRGLYQKILHGWNIGSGSALADQFTEDGEIVGFDGTQINGRKEISSNLQEIFDKYGSNRNRFVGKTKNVKFLTPGIALMHAIAGMVMAGHSEINPQLNSIQRLVFVKRDKEWRVAALQNTPAQFHGRPDEVQTLTEELSHELPNQ
jgi:uncharacterized protein (TIGR02246 family)